MTDNEQNQDTFARGELHIQRIKADGTLGESAVVLNAIFNEGFRRAGRRLFEPADTMEVFDQIVVGSSNASPGGVGYRMAEQEAVSSPNATYNQNSNTEHQLQYTFTTTEAAGSSPQSDEINVPSGGEKEIQESGIASSVLVNTDHNASFNRTTFSPIPLTLGDSLQVTWKVTLSQ